jgi:transposase InsO family protein
MAQDHDRIEELLAGHALEALAGEDAIEADRLLAEHVPTCPMCRETLAGFRGVAERLSLAAAAVRPPELLLARIRRSMREDGADRRTGGLRLPLRAGRRGAFVAAAASVAALVGMAALSMSLGTRATRAQTHLDRMTQLVDALAQPGAAPVSLRALGARPMLEISGPNLERMIVAGHGVPRPARDFVYVIWVGTADGFRPLGTVVPDADGFVFRAFTVDPSSFDRIMITEERAGVRWQAPRSDSPHMWQATL